jgi:hypothetical protein
MLLSIDIGIRNLSLCIMDCTDKTDLNSYKIHLLDTFNTLENDLYTCNGIQKSGKVCGKKCSLKYNANDNFIYSCKTHFPKTIKIEKKNIYKVKLVKDYLLQDIAKIVLARIDTIYNDNLHLFKSTTQILLELQPGKNASMKFISHIIYGKFVELYKDSQTTIRFVRASMKLKAYQGPEVVCKLKGKYQQTKWLSIQYAKWFLENKFTNTQCEKWLPVLLGGRADNADTMLMAINGLFGIPKKQKTNFKKKNMK